MLRVTTDGLPTGNALKDVVNLEVESRLSNTAKFTNASTIIWYLFAAATDVPMIAGYLRGMRAPTVRSFGLAQHPGELAISYDVFFDIGFALGDPRAGVKSTGAT